jgi:hypothetical protein
MAISERQSEVDLQIKSFVIDSTLLQKKPDCTAMAALTVLQRYIVHLDLIFRYNDSICPPISVNICHPTNVG